jgi:two-component system response regulator
LKEPMHNKVILLVEDNPDDELLTLRAFQQSHIRNELIVARSGLEALDWLLARGEHAGRAPGLPQVVLLDLNMPKVNGLEVLRAIRADETTKRLPVVILTSSTEEQDLIRSYDLGANSYVKKPVDFGQFLEAVRELGLYWLVLNEVAPAG